MATGARRILWALEALVCLVCLIVLLVLLVTMPSLPIRNPGGDCLQLSGDSGYGRCGETDKQHVYLTQKIDDAYGTLESNQRAEDANRPELSVKLRGLLQESFFPMTPAIHVKGSGQPDTVMSDSDGSLVSIKDWTVGSHPNHREGFQRYGMQLRRGRLVVPVTGFYSVYSFIAVDERPMHREPADVSKNRHIVHAIYKYNIITNKETELFSSSQCRLVPESDQYSEYNSYVQSVVELDIGDEVLVKITNGTFFKRPSQNYFGANMI